MAKKEISCSCVYSCDRSRYSPATRAVSAAPFFQYLRSIYILLFLVVEARDAWIQADEDLYNGANKCNLFQAFASRGLGLNADSSFVDDDTVPAGC